MRGFVVFSVWLWIAVGPALGQVAQWREGGESGTAHIVDGTQSSYDLLQSDVVAEGSFAFHLANPDFTPSWFAIDQDISVSEDTQLFFRSQLRAMTEDQIAQVQLSTDGGINWPTTIFSQTGVGAEGESAFTLRDVSLGSFAGQDVRLRFQLDFSAGLAFTGTDVRNGWLVDDIQIGAEFQKIQYGVGNPSPVEQLYLEFTNRAREDAMVEAGRLREETTPSILNAYGFFQIDPDDIVDQYDFYVNQNCIDQHAQPLSFNGTLMTVSALHSQDMFDNEFQGHVSSSNPPAPLQPGDTFGDRLDRVGYVGSAGENLFAFARSVANGHAGLTVDWGNNAVPGRTCYNPAFADQGMQNPAGHRINLHNGSFKEIGISVVEGTNGSVGPQVLTQNFGNPGDVTYVTGVVYEDLNGNQFYDVGEGREGVRVDADGSAYFAISTASGAYSLPVDQDGEYVVTFRGGGYSAFSTTARVVDGLNAKVDYLVQPFLLTCDFSGDGMCTTADLDAADGMFSVGDLTRGVDVDATTTLFDLDGNQRVDSADLQHWLGQAAEHAGFTEPFQSGDTDLDGDVDFADFLNLSNSFGLTGAWGEGNFDGSPMVDFADFLRLSGNFGQALQQLPTSVPEPAAPTGVIVLMLWSFLTLRRSARHSIGNPRNVA